jgi:hypothetical protein
MLTIAAMEPLLPEDQKELEDLATDLVAKANGLAGRLNPAWAHRSFCERLPDEMLWVENPDTKERLRVVPGKLRDRGESRQTPATGAGPT